MSRTRGLVAGVSWAAAVGTVWLYAALLGLQPTRINVRWADGVGDEQRARAQRELTLTAGEHQSETTWTYGLGDRSRQNIERIVRHPLIVDTHHIDRRTFRLAPDVDRLPGWERAFVQAEIVRSVEPRLRSVALVFAAIGLIALLPAAAAACAAAWRRRAVRLVAPILVIALGLRVWLVLGGGQMFWVDEVRYYQARDMAEKFVRGDMMYSLHRMANGQHPLFSVVGMIPATIERTIGDDLRIPALFFAGVSVVNIGLLAWVAIRSGATEGEAAIAAALLAASATFFYYARHLLPYDVAMFFGLLTLGVALGSGRSIWSSFICGVLAGCTFLTYTGYWTFGGTALVIHVVTAHDRRTAFRRAVVAALGLTTIVLLVVAGTIAAGENLARSFVEFSRTVNQGSYAEGWRLPWEYLWHAEHGLLVAWIVSVAFCLLRARRGLPSKTAAVGLIGVACLYAFLCLGSVALHQFVVYGRLARQLVPFLCLTTVGAIRGFEMIDSRRQRAVAGVGLLLVAQAAYNFATPLRQIFPSEFVRGAPAGAPVSTGATLLTINTTSLYPHPEPVSLPPRYVVVREARHPMEFLPYQYEGLTASQRDVLRTTDITMRVVAVLP